jgi:hypothetical protein
MLTAIAETGADGSRGIREPLSWTLEFLALAALADFLAGELAKTPPPFAMNNKAEAFSAVVVAPHDTFFPKGSTAARTFSSPKSACSGQQ